MLSRKKSVSCRVGLLSPMVFMLIAVGVLFVACPAPEDEGGGKTDITGSFTYNPVNATEGVPAVSEKPSWEGGAAGQTVTYSISVSPTTEGITVAAATGVVTVADTVTAGTYTVKVTATGSGDYSGTKEATLTVTVEKKAGLSYEQSEVTVLIGNPEAMTIASKVLNPNSLTLSYKGGLSDGSSLPNGISVNDSTGKITIEGNNLPALAKSYTVKVDMTGTGAGGVSETASAEVTVVVKHSLGMLSYKAVSVQMVADGTSETRTPSWSNAWSVTGTPERTATYTIAPSDATVQINPDSGVVTVPVTAVLSQTYTITATPTGAFGGDSAEATLSVAVTNKPLIDGTFSYGEEDYKLETTYGTEKSTGEPAWKNRTNDTQTVEYSVSAADNERGITVNTTSGVVTVAATAPAGAYTVKVTATGSGEYGGAIDATIAVNVTHASITGNFSYSLLLTTYGKSETSVQPGWRDRTDAAQTVTYSITDADKERGITVDPDSGAVSTGTSLPLGGTYIIVTATGTGNYTGSITTTLQINTKVQLGLSYDGKLVALIGDPEPATSSLPSVTNDASSTRTWTYSYTATLKDGSDLPGGITIKLSTGVISVAGAQLPDSVTSYTVKVTVSSDNAISADTELQIEVKRPLGNLSYEVVSVTVDADGTAETRNPAWVNDWNTSDAVPRTATYTIDPSDTTVQIDPASGKVTVPVTAVLSQTYTITATPTGDFGGDPATATISVVVAAKPAIDGIFSYGEEDYKLETTYGTEKSTGAPAWTGSTKDDQTVTYSVSEADKNKGITVDPDSGDVTVAATAPAGTYTVKVTATGTGDYVGTLSVDLTVTVAHIAITGTFSYASGDNTTYTVRANSGGKPSVMPQWTSATEGQSVEYSIEVDPTVDEGVTVASDTGVVTFESGVDVDTYTITVTATGKDNYEGMKAATLTLEVKDEITLGNLVWNGYNGHDYLRPHKGTGFTSTTPTWSDQSGNPATSPTVSYKASFNDLPAELTLATSTGAISGTATTAQYPTGCWLSITSTTDGTVMTPVTILITDKKATDRLNLIELIEDEIRDQEDAKTPNLNKIDTSAVTSMFNLFDSIDDVTLGTFNPDISGWDVSKVEDMNSMFKKASAFNGDISNWNVGMVTNMSYMFSGATAFNKDLNNWNVGMVTKMSYMFIEATAFNGDISNWNVSKVENMSFMFSEASAFNKDLNNWNVGMVTNMSFMFSEASAFNKDLNNWNVGMVKNMSFMFYNASAFNKDLNNWNVSKVENMSDMFNGATSFNKDLNNWNVGIVTDMSYMFAGATAFNGAISNWDVSAVEDMSDMFRGTYDSSERKYISTFNQDISGWNVSAVTEMSFMFVYATAFNQNLGAWGEHLTGRTVTMTDMFSDSGVTSPPSWYE